MKILFLTPGCFDKGGISRYSRHQITALREIAGASSVAVLSLLGPNADSIEAPFSVDFHASGNAAADKARFVAAAIAMTARHRPAIVHAAHVNLSGFAALIAALARATTILNVYGLEVWSGFRRDAAWGLRRADTLISDCHFTARYLAGEGLRDPARTAVIWDPVDVDRMRPGAPNPAVIARYGIPDPSTHINVLTLGRLSRIAAHKGYDRLLDVFARIAPKIPSLRLVYAGRGDLTDVLRARAESLGLADRVRFTGPIHEDDLADVYRSGHVFSLVSDRGPVRGEGIPLTPLEAAACGLPILVGDQDGSQEAVIEGQNGFIVSPFALDLHAERILHLAEDEAARRAMAAAARRRIEDHFSVRRFVDEHRALLDAHAARARRTR